MGASREHRQRLYEQLVGQTLAGRFEVTSLLGFGGMGAVYQALQRNMQRDVAIKVIPSHDPTTTARFEREALTISKLHHPNTVTVFDYGKTDQGLLFLAMEMLSGHTLSGLIENHGPLTPNRAVHIASQVCRSLYEAHQSDIVHRDVKPDNIFLIEVDDDPDFVKVLDFGIAKIVRGEDNVELTGTGRIIGTPKYMSPEQILAEAVDHRSDIYSLACIVFEMICGSPPFRDTSTTKLMLAHAHQAPPSFSERLPDQALARIPGPLEHVVRRALSKSPSERHRTIDEFRIDLEEALEATDHKLRISQLANDPFSNDPFSNDQLTSDQSKRGTPTQTVPGQKQPSGSSTVTDSSDLLSQYSSQTLAKLKRPADLDAPPTAEVEERDHNSGKSKAPVYAIVAILAVIAGLVGYMALHPDDKPKEVEVSGFSQSEIASAAQANERALQQEEEEEEPVEATAPAPEKPVSVEIRVVSEPEGAHVYEEGRSVGKTPLMKNVEAGTTLSYSFELDGYLDKEARHVVDADEPSPTFSVTLEKEPEAKSERRSTNSRPKNRRSTRSKKADPKEDKSKAAAESDTVDAKPDDAKPNVEMLSDEDSKPNIDILD